MKLPYYSPRMLLAFVLIVVFSGLAIAAHYFFNVAFTWDSEPANNEAAVQNRAGQLNVAKAVGDTVTAYFLGTPTPYGHYVRRFLISSNAFEQTGGPFYVGDDGGGGGGGGGTCSIFDPSTTMVSLDGLVKNLGAGLAHPLTLLGTAEDGTRFVREQFAVVREDQGVLEFTLQSFGFTGVKNEVQILGNPSDQVSAEMPIGASADGAVLLALDDMTTLGTPRQFLLVQHQGEHPQNHRYAPIPHVTFVRQHYRLAAGSSRRGWAVVSFGSQGDVQAVQLLPADGLEGNRALAAKVRAGVRGEFRDQRRHPFTAYFAYKVADNGLLTMTGPPFVSLPMCVGGGDECN